MKEFVEKLIGRLEEESKRARAHYNYGNSTSYNYAIEIVKELAKNITMVVMEHDGCVGCKYENESVESKYCLGCKQNAIDKYTPMTNADKIRSMSDEELAEFLIRQQACDNCEYFGGGSRCKAPNEFKCTNEYATAVVQKWLQSEVKGSE